MSLEPGFSPNSGGGGKQNSSLSSVSVSIGGGSCANETACLDNAKIINYGYRSSQFM